MTERDKAIKIADAVLGRQYTDPDGNICILARQFLRGIEKLTCLQSELNAAGAKIEAALATPGE